MEALKRAWQRTPKLVRRLFVSIVGLAIILAGVAMLVLPGPGWVTIFLGLAVLSTEFEWAERVRKWTISRFKSALEALRPKKKQAPGKPPTKQR